jgi:uncharacterized protein YutE (UPF0331/DUF86 family)
MPPDEEQDEPQAVGEGRELLDLNFFPSEGKDRYSRAEEFRENAIRLIVFDLQLAIEELLKAAIHRRIAEHSVLDPDRDIEYVKGMNGSAAIDLAARLGVIDAERHQELVELNGLRNRAGHRWVLDEPELGPKGPKPGSYPLRWKGGRLTPKRVREQFLPHYSDLYLRMYMEHIEATDVEAGSEDA